MSWVECYPQSEEISLGNNFSLKIFKRSENIYDTKSKSAVFSSLSTVLINFIKTSCELSTKHC